MTLYIQTFFWTIQTVDICMFVACAVCAGVKLAAKPGAPSLPPRPGFGTKGRPIELTTNFFRVRIPPNMTLYHYDVDIQPKIPRPLKRKVMQAAVEQNTLFSGQFPVFDGEKNMYCHKKLPEAQVYVLLHRIA